MKRTKPLTDSFLVKRGSKIVIKDSDIEVKLTELNPDDFSPTLEATEKGSDENEEACTNASFCNIILPDCWTTEQYLYFTNRYKWLEVRQGLLGCKMCAEVETLGDETRKHLHISSQWRNFAIKACGELKAVKQSSLRKKMKEHDESQSHSKVISILQRREMASTNTDKEKICEISKNVRIFNILYSLVKRNISISNVYHEIELHRKNEMDCKMPLYSYQTITSIVDHIAKEMRKEIFAKLVSQQSKICIIIDEVFILSTYCLIIYLRFEVIEAENPVDMFVDIIELYSVSAGKIVDKLLKCLCSYGVDDCYMKNNLIAFCYDGASKLLGQQSNVAATIFNKYPDIILWPCLSHRLQFTVNEAVRHMDEVNHFKIFFDDLCVFYHQSYKNQNELVAIASDLGKQIGKINRFDQCLATCKLNIALAIWNNYPSLYSYFESRNEWSRLKEKLESINFITNLALVIDILQQLSYLSEALQQHGISIVAGYRLIKKTIRNLQDIKDHKGEYEQKVTININSQMFKHIHFKFGDENVKLLPKLKLYQNVIDQMNMRLISTVFSDRSRSDKEDAKTYEELFDCFRILESETWPNDVVSPWSEGEAKLESLSRQIKYNIPLNHFRTYVDNFDLKRKTLPKTIIRAKKIVKVIAIDSEEVERGFNGMYDIVTKENNSLLSNDLSNLMFIKIFGKPIDRFNAKPFVISWLNEHRPSATDSNTICDIQRYNQNNEEIWKLLN